MKIHEILRFASLYCLYSMAAINSDQMDLLRIFNEHGVKYVLYGGAALELHGVRKSGGDIDVLVQPSKENSPKVYEALKEWGGLPLGLYSITPNSFTQSEYGGPKNLIGIGNMDILTGHPRLFFGFDELYSRKEVINGINVASLNDIITMKMKSDREKDLFDLMAICEFLIRSGEDINTLDTLFDFLMQSKLDRDEKMYLRIKRDRELPVAPVAQIIPISSKKKQTKTKLPKAASMGRELVW